MSPSINRRTFSMTAVSAATTAAAALSVNSGCGTRGSDSDPNEQVRLGFIGVGNRGCQLLRAFQSQADAKIVALCDVYEPYLAGDKKRIDPRFAGLTWHLPQMPKLRGTVDRVNDFRRILDRKDIDAVVIATPDHWHAIQMISACKAGKDVYVEKPLSTTIAEGRAMVEAARSHDRIAQVGIQRRSSRLFAQLAEVVRSGAIGKITVARAGFADNMAPVGIGHEEACEPPAGLDWDMWLGPRPARPYQANIAPYKFRWWDGYSSQMANWGVHYLDLMRWLTGELAPASVTAVGGRYAVDDDRTIPDTCEVIFEHGSKMLTIISIFEANGQSMLRPGAEVELRGTLGTIYASPEKYEIVAESGGRFQDPKPRRKGEVVKSTNGGLNELDALAARDFLDNVKTRKRPVADIEDGHRSTCLSHMANIALATRQRLDWDAQAERFTNCDAANQMLHYEYRKPWSLT